MSVRLVILRLFVGCWCANALVDAGELVRHNIESERLAGSQIGVKTSQELFVYLPDGYNESQTDYPVVYWFPGGGQGPVSGIDFGRLDDEFESGRSAESIIVFMPSKEDFGSTLYLSSPAFGDWEGFLFDEAIPSIDQTYKTQSTSDKRGIMGFSQGGLTALLMPLRHPDLFGAVGVNDPSMLTISGFVRNVDELPEGVFVDPDVTPEESQQQLEDFFDAFPETLADYNKVPLIYRLYGQLAASLTPNAEVPLQGDFPLTRDGQWNPEVRATWRDLDLLDPNSVENHRDSLERLATVSVIVPDAEAAISAPWNQEMVRVLGAAGIPAQSIPFTGDHNDSQHERFSALLANVTYSLRDESKSAVAEDTYRQSFDADLGSDDAAGVDLPMGWAVTDGLGHVFRDSTNTAFNGGNFEPVGLQPHILNVGTPQAADRALAVYLPENSEGATIQLLTDISSVKGNSLQLKFNLEVWDWLQVETIDDEVQPDGQEVIGMADDGSLGEAAFRVVAEIDYGSGFEPLLDIGTVTTGATLQKPSGALLDGNASENRTSFDSGILMAALEGAQELRLRWIADSTSDSWVFGLDDVELDFFFVGDFDDDDLLTANDIDLLSLAIRENSSNSEFDINRDGFVDSADHDYWVQDLFLTELGDANLDNSVTFADFVDLAANFGEAAGWAAGDFNGDGEVQFQDFSLLVSNFGRTTVASAAVPEPSANILLVLATALIGAARRRLA